MAIVNTETITKRVAIDKSNFQMIVTISIASFITIFCLIAAQSISRQSSYQSRVISAKKLAQQQLIADTQAYQSLKQSYTKFESSPKNIIGGSSKGVGTGNNSGSNAVIVLDALPDKYDFPGLISTISKLLNAGGYDVAGISGTDEGESAGLQASTADPSPQAIPFSFGINQASYTQAAQLFSLLEHSIRPIAVDSINVTGDGNNLTLNVSAHTYYQPDKSLAITSRAVQ
jgi:type II secretory pathway pseudopilin PulG